MKKVTLISGVIIFFLLAGCTGTEDLVGGSGDYLITVIPGDEWIHEYSFLTKNPPQFALWIEDSSNSYAGSVFVTRKTATEGWVFNDGNRRIEALPVWAHRRNIVDESGILMPSKEEPLTDGITGATPKDEHEILVSPSDAAAGFWLYMEVNHSTDFNSNWPEDAEKGDENWSGGAGGSGQPSLVYRAWIDPSANDFWTLELLGHGSPDGSEGNIYPDVNSLTSALEILGKVKVEKLQ